MFKVYGVFYTLGFNPQLFGLFSTKEKAEQAIRDEINECFGPWTADSGWTTSEEMVEYFIDARQMHVKELYVS